MMCVSYPREGTESADHDGDVGDYPHYKNGIVCDIEVAEIVNDLEQQPDDTRKSTTAMNTTQMLRLGVSLFVRRITETRETHLEN